MNKFIKYATSVAGLATLVACSGGTCAPNDNPVGDLTLAIEAPSQYPAGLPVPIQAQLTMTNTSKVNASNLVYTVPAIGESGNYTGVTITPDAGIGSASGACTNIAAGASCTFIATIGAYAKPGSFIVTATPNGTASSNTKTTNSTKSLQAGSISVTANLGLVDIPNTNNEYYVLPSEQTISGSTTGSTIAYVSVLVKAAGEGLNSFKLVDEAGAELVYEAVGSQKYTVNSVNNYKVTMPAGKALQHIQVLSNVCTTLNTGDNNNTACSNDADVNVAQSGVGILAIQPNYFKMSESVQSQVIKLQNIGTGNITNLQLPEISAPFSVLSNTCASVSTLAPTASCLVTIGYTVGVNSGQGSYVVNYNNGNSAVNTTATIPYIGSTPSLYAVLTTSPSSFSLSQAHSTQRITLTNTGTAPATSLSLLPLISPLQESSTTTCTSSLGVGVSCHYDVYIDYTQPVSASSEPVTFAYNNGQSNQTISVAADWASKQLEANLTLSSSTVDLGSVYNQRTITVTNTGSAVATNLVLPVLLPPVYVYQNTTTCIAGQNLAPQESCAYTLSYPGATSSSSQAVNFGYSGGTVSTVPLTIDWAQATQWAYLVRNDLSNPGVYKCTLGASGDISGCIQQANSTSVQRGRDLTFNVVNGVKYLYVADYQAGGIFKCTLSAMGDINSCTNITASTPASGIEAGYIVFGSVNNIQYAYFTDTNNKELFTCQVKVDGDFDNCNSIPFDNIGGMNFTTIGNSPYLYANADINSSAGILRFPLNSTTGQPLINDQPLVVLPYSANSITGMDIYKFNGVEYLYSGYTGPVGSSWTLSANGSTVSDQINFANINNLPYSINFTTATDMTPYGYVQSTGGIFQCNVNQTTGALTGCANTTAAMGVSVAFSLFEPRFVVGKAANGSACPDNQQVMIDNLTGNMWVQNGQFGTSITGTTATAYRTNPLNINNNGGYCGYTDWVLPSEAQFSCSNTSAGVCNQSNPGLITAWNTTLICGVNGDQACAGPAEFLVASGFSSFYSGTSASIGYYWTSTNSWTVPSLNSVTICLASNCFNGNRQPGWIDSGGNTDAYGILPVRTPI